MNKMIFVILCTLPVYLLAQTPIENEIELQEAEELSFNPDTASVDFLIAKSLEHYNNGKYGSAANVTSVLVEQLHSKYGEADSSYIEWISSLGVFLQNDGRLDTGLPYLEKGVELAQKHFGDKHGLYVINLNNLGTYYILTNDYSQAIKAFEKVVKAAKVAFGEEHVYYSIFLSNLAYIHSDLHQFDKALPYELEALEITEKLVGKNHEKYAKRLNNIAHTYLSLGQPEQALPIFEESIAIREDLGNIRHPNFINSLINLSRTHYDLKQYEKALSVGLKAEELAKEVITESHPEYLRSPINLGKIYRKMGQYPAAKAYFLRAEQLADNNDYEEYSWRRVLLNELIFVNEEMGALDEMAQYCVKSGKEVIEAVQSKYDQLGEAEQKTLHEVYAANVSIISSYALKYPELLSIQEIGSTVVLLEKGMRMGYRKELMQAVSESSDPNIQAIFEQWTSSKEAIAHQYSLSANERDSAFSEMLSSVENYERQLILNSESFRKARQLVSFKDLQEKLMPGEAIIDFYSFNFNTQGEFNDSLIQMAFLIRKEDETPIAIPLFEKNDLKSFRAVRHLYNYESRNGKPNLNQLVWQPLSQYLEGISKIYFSPSGLLHKINFGAIPVSENQSIADRFELLNMGNVRQLVFQEDIPNFEITDASIFGGIQYETDNSLFTSNTRKPNKDALVSNTRGLEESFSGLRGNDWGYLEWAEKEARDIQKILENEGAKVDLKTGYQASEAAFKAIGKEKPSPRILHLATHGYFFPDVDTTASSGFRASKHPLIRSGLILANANEAWKGNPPKEGEDGILTAYEIAQMDLSNTELAVLSACDTGLGDIEGNEGVYGLQRAFKMAGVKYLLMSLWKVNDAEAYEFMTTFYKEWQVEGKSIPDAYRAAQGYMRTLQPNNPRSWAGFVLVE